MFHILICDIAIVLSYAFTFYQQIIFQSIYLYIFFILDDILKRRSQAKVAEVYSVFVKQLPVTISGSLEADTALAFISILTVTATQIIVIFTPKTDTPSDLSISLGLVTVISWMWDNNWVVNLNVYISRFDDHSSTEKVSVALFVYVLQFVSKYIFVVFVTAVVIEGKPRP